MTYNAAMRSRHARKIIVTAAALAVAAGAYYWMSRLRDLETITADYYARSAKLAADLDHADEQRARKILNELATYGSLAEPAVPAIVALCEHDNLSVRYAAYHALGRIGDERGLEPLLDVIRTERRGNRGLLWRVSEALTMFRDPDLLMPLLQMSADGVSGEVWGTAIFASVRAINQQPESIIDAMSHDDREIREWAIRFTRNMSSWLHLRPEAQDYITTELKRLVEDDTNPVHADLLNVLNYLEWPSSKNWDDESMDKEVVSRFEFQGWTFERLVRAKGDDAVPILLEALDSVPNDQLLAVLEALAYLRADEAVEPLIHQLETFNVEISETKYVHMAYADIKLREWVVNALWDITGENFGAITEAWRAWYREQH